MLQLFNTCHVIWVAGTFHSISLRGSFGFWKGKFERPTHPTAIWSGTDFQPVHPQVPACASGWGHSGCQNVSIACVYNWLVDVGGMVKMTSSWKDGFTILCWNLDAGGLFRLLNGARRNHLLKMMRSSAFNFSMFSCGSLILL